MERRNSGVDVNAKEMHRICAICGSEITQQDTVRNNQGECNFDFTIVHPANVIEKLFDYEFEQTELLNYSLMDYMLEYIPDDKKLRILLNQVVNRSENSRQFILGYLSRKNQTKKFVEQILMLSSMVWKDIEADSILTEEQKYIYLNEILCFGTIEGIVSNNYKEYRLHNSEYNRILCEKLKKRGYITGVTVKGNYLEGYVRKK